MANNKNLQYDLQNRTIITQIKGQFFLLKILQYLLVPFKFITHH